MARHYLDFASTVPLRPEAAAAIGEWMGGPGGDPGRVHEEGRAVRAAIEGAREEVAALAGVVPRQVVFTSGATEAINAAVWGAARAANGGSGESGGSSLVRESVSVCAAVEHSAVREAAARMGPVVVPAVDRLGRILPEALAEALEDAQAVAEERVLPISLVHVQWANHEVGTIQPLAELIALCREAGVPVHVDAAAAFGHLPTDPALAEADLVSVSGHKLGAPPGVGALVVRRGRRFEPLLVGGQQERARRGGLENVPGIVGFGAAAAALLGEGGQDGGDGGGGSRLAEEAVAATRWCRALLEAALAVDGVSLVGDPDPAGRLPHLVCLGVEGVEAEPVLIGLDRAGIAAHSGSACSSESLEPSPVLEAMGADPSHSLRLSVGWSTTEDDVAAFASAFGPVVRQLRGLRG